ncbi:MAG: 3-isopropylmalate dehydratase small subunit [Smithellaceae bacterium]|nr:3-isopropylmalate dehydratase small subunit [Smithellaceae bacterium]
MRFKGKAWKFDDNIDTDVIIPARYLTTSDPAILARHCMEDADPLFVSKIKAGDIIVAGENFGCGSSREHAPIAIKAAGISCVIARSFARIFYRNAFNMGLPIFEAPDLWQAVNDGQEIEIDGDRGLIRLGMIEIKTSPIPPFMQELIEAGGLMKYMTKRKETTHDGKR